MALTNDSVSRYLEEIQKHQFALCSEKRGSQGRRMHWEGVTYFSPSSPDFACVSNILFHLFSSDSCTEIAPLTAEIAVESFLWSGAGGLSPPLSQCSLGKRRGRSRGNIGVYGERLLKPKGGRDVYEV